MNEFLRKRPWIWIVIGFAVLIGSWVVFMKIAIQNRPEEVPLEHLVFPAKPD